MVSVLFCDLVGFTATSESADPEEVQARIAPYHDADARADRGVRRHGGEVHRRRGDGGLRRPRGARGRSGARRAGGPRAAGGDRGVERGRRVACSVGAGRREHRRGGSCARRAAGAGRGDGDRRRRQHRRPDPVAGAGERGRGRGGHVPGDGAGVRVRVARLDRREGKVGAGRRLAGAATEGALRLGRDPVDDDAPRRARARLHLAAWDVRQGDRGTVGAAGHGRRRARGGQVAARGGAVRAR